MTLEQLAIFVAVAEREHLTRAAEAIHLTPSAVSSAIKALEVYHDVELFHRVGRRIELTEIGRRFLVEARATLARARSAEQMLSEFGGLQRGRLSLCASQTIASYWLPPRLMRFHEAYPGIELDVTIGNTRTVAEAVLDGRCEFGLAEGEVSLPALSVKVVAQDALVVVVSPRHAWADGRALSVADLASGTSWVMREEGSGTRSEFEAVLERGGVVRQELQVALVMPSNEAVLSAVRAGRSAAAISSAAAGIFLQEGLLVKAEFALPVRDFRLLRHKERHASKAATAFEAICAGIDPQS